MKNENNQKEIFEVFEELEKRAKEIYPTIDKDIETFNSMRVEQESYLNYLSLLNEQPLPKASNQTCIE
ncbi:MAG: hypothetical protein FJ213_06595 [Ignavibacteria bacterium]|nr:hypothetical protein [Ignavibacteria bacterium]